MLNCVSASASTTSSGRRKGESRPGPINVSHTRAVLPRDAVTTRLPSGLNAAEKTSSSYCRGWPTALSAAAVRSTFANVGITAEQLEPQQPKDHIIGKRRRLRNLGQAILHA
jgi:hypothetical protein